MKPHIFKRDGTWKVWLPALNWMTPGALATGTLPHVLRLAANWSRFEAERLARR